MPSDVLLFEDDFQGEGAHPRTLPGRCNWKAVALCPSESGLVPP